MKPEIKPFNELNADELYKLLKLRFDVFVIEQTCIYNEFDNIDQNAVHIYCKDEDEITAYLRVYKKNDNTVSIGRVAVAEQHRGKDLARKTMHNALEFVRTNWKLDKIEIEAQVYLKTFYEEFGFKQTSETYDDCGIPHISMQLALK